MTTAVNALVLRAALQRGGIWLVNLAGAPTKFYHRDCVPLTYFTVGVGVYEPQD